MARVRAEMTAQSLEPDGREEELLRLAEQLANRLAELEGTIAVDGVRVKLDGGRVLFVLDPRSSHRRAGVGGCLRRRRG